MPGDYTRFSFVPSKGFSGVRKQQGRVSLDADFNELEEILDRRRRAEMYDTVGQAVVPATTEHGFEIGVSGGKLNIGIGRAYVDGLLVECFGDISDPSKSVRDDILGGVLGLDAVAYDEQPFFFSPAFPSLATASGTLNLVYLDAWQREVTVFEDAELRESALNGPDTATRVQTAWQVRALPVSGATTCEVPPPPWDALTAPSTARLSVNATSAVTAPAPCVISPAGGYTGLENRLYRVEVHKAGTLGGGLAQATFKWSRDNASITASVVSISTVGLKSAVTVSSTGPDAWRRLEHGDHVELLDDDIELAMRTSGVGGMMARVDTVNHATGEVVLTTNPSFTVVAGRHPRMRRWDAATPTEPLERSASAGSVQLEEGIAITFVGTAASTLHAGDYWVFAARTADGNVGPLDNAPPRGILHHFMRLALVVSGATPSVKADCRRPWPPALDAGCGELVVAPGADVQAIFDLIPPNGDARLCFHPGTWMIASTIDVSGKGNLVLTGAGAGSSLKAGGLDRIIAFSDCKRVVIQDLAFDAGATSLPVRDDGTSGANGLLGALDFHHCGEVDLSRVHVSIGRPPMAGGSPSHVRQACAVHVTGDPDATASTVVRIRDCRIRVAAWQTGILCVDVEAAYIEDSDVTGQATQLTFDLAARDASGAAFLVRDLMDNIKVGDRAMSAGPRFGRARVEVDGPLAGQPFSFDTNPVLGAALQKYMETFQVHGAATATDTWVLANLRRLRRRAVTVGASFSNAMRIAMIAWRSAFDAKALLIAGDQGIVVGTRRTPTLSEGWIGGHRDPSVRIRGNRVHGFAQGIHLGASDNKRHGGAPSGGDDNRRRRRICRVSVVDNEVHLVVGPIIRERHGIFVGNVQSATIRDNTVETISPKFPWHGVRPIDGIRAWGIFGPLMQISGNQLVGVVTGVRVVALNPGQATDPGIAWRVADNAWVGPPGGTSVSLNF